MSERALKRQLQETEDAFRIVDEMLANRDAEARSLRSQVERLTAELSRAHAMLDSDMPRWDADRLVIEQGWNTPDRCGRCGEVNPQVERYREVVEAAREWIASSQWIWDREFGYECIDGCNATGDPEQRESMQHAADCPTLLLLARCMRADTGFNQ